eukprot:TRINITY_DN27091_c0_g1_i1.p3 TRINITY_DN27091_c0_g1~~TRINITY_DN27091_c0_g1_i1.p3  ORF type:complete len:168 (+),score=73.04 TRINITY_DN27091_c0_g1_i1:63-566(+)
MALTEAQALFLPVSLGTIAMIFSYVWSIFVMNKPRYALKEFKHPYAPWQAGQDDPQVYRGWKASENQREWLAITIPFAWIFALYAPTLDCLTAFIPLPLPALGSVVVEWSILAASLVWAHANLEYMKGYMESTEARVPPFHLRTNAFKFIAFGAIISCLAALVRLFV